ncbi:MAG: phosphoadenylyl-sulfate reductase [Caldilineaceae bacterium]
MEAVLTMDPVSTKNTVEPIPFKNSSSVKQGNTANKAPASDALSWANLVFARLNNRFGHGEANDVMAWASETFGTGLSIGTSFGTSGIVLMDLALQVNPDVDIFYIDTDFFFPETHALIARLEQHYQRGFRAVKTNLTVAQQEKRYGPKLYENDPNLCCHLRKVEPLKQALADSTAWATALRRDQASTRTNTPMVQWNTRYNLVKLAPMVRWTETDIWQYIHEHQLPYNELHDRNYPSIGCWPCTKPVQPGEDLRSGRWQGKDKIECGIHLDNNTDGAGI